MNNLFNDDFVLDVKSNLENKSYACLIDILDMAIESNQKGHYIEAINFLTYVRENFKLGVLLDFDFDHYYNNPDNLINLLQNIKDQIQPQILKNSHLERFDSLFSNDFLYEFSEESISKIQTLINELRELVNSSDLFEAEHKQRLLKRLEKLQSEIHKKMSDVDRFWGLIGDAGVVIGKFGKDAEPFVNIIKKISGLVWKTQLQTEELPENNKHPLLENTE